MGLLAGIARPLAARPAAVPASAPPPSGQTWTSEPAHVAHLDSIINPMSGLGGVGDKGQAGYVDIARPRLDRMSLTALYTKNGYARRFVNIMPEEACRKGFIIDDSSDEAAPLADEMQAISLVPRLQEGLTWGRLYGGAILLMVTDEDVPAEYRRPDGTPDPRWLETPLDLARVRGLRNLVVCTPFEAMPIAYESRLSEAGFREPSMWQVFPHSGGGGFASMRVHASRVVYCAGARLPPIERYANGGIDDSVLQSTWDAIRAKTTIDQAGAVLAQEIQVAVLKIEGLAALATGDQSELLGLRMKQMAQSRSVLNTVVLSDGDSYDNHSVSLAGWKDLDGQSMSTLSAVTGLPQTVWFGDAPGGLNTDGESHKALMANLVAAYQTHTAQPPLEQVVAVMYAARANSGGAPVPESWSIVWHPLAEMSEQQTADLRSKLAATDVAYIDAGVVTPEHVAASRFAGTGFNAEMLPVDDAELAALEAAKEAASEGAALEGSVLEATATEKAAKAAAEQATAGATTTDEAPDDPDQTDAERFAAEMTAAGVDRCPHDRVHMCDRCGIKRSYSVNPDGSFGLAWRAIRPSATAQPAAGNAPEPAK